MRDIFSYPEEQQTPLILHDESINSENEEENEEQEELQLSQPPPPQQQLQDEFPDDFIVDENDVTNTNQSQNEEDIIISPDEDVIIPPNIEIDNNIPLLPEGYDKVLQDSLIQQNQEEEQQQELPVENHIIEEIKPPKPLDRIQLSRERLKASRQVY